MPKCIVPIARTATSATPPITASTVSTMLLVPPGLRSAGRQQPHYKDYAADDEGQADKHRHPAEAHHARHHGLHAAVHRAASTASGGVRFGPISRKVLDDGAAPAFLAGAAGANQLVQGGLDAAQVGDLAVDKPLLLRG